METDIPDVNFRKGCNNLLLVRWSFIPEHFLWTHRLHEVHKMELAPTQKVHAPQGYNDIESKY